MKSHAIVPAVLADTPPPGDGATGLSTGRLASPPYAPLFDDVYHAAAGAFEQAEHVFLRGNGLPERWQGRPRFVILETGFGLGNNFLATWAAWRRDPRRSERLIFLSIEKHPLTRDDLARVHERSAQPELARALIEQWPALTPNLHTLVFDEQRVQLLLALGDVADMLPALQAEVDAFYLDGFAPAKNPDMWSEQTLKRLSRLAAPGATAATWSIARGVRDGLTLAGFEVRRAPGFAGKRDMLTARFAPRHVPARPSGQPRTPHCEPTAMVIGAGLAGCAAAWALAEQGWTSTVLDRQPQPASEASGNPAGLFHGIIHGEDGRHARLYRAAALTAARLLRPWIEQGRVRGQCQGLLRLEPRLDDASARALLDKLGLPDSYVRWLTQPESQARSGLPVPSGGWLFGEGGWVSPGDYARTLLADSGARFAGAEPVARLSREGSLWCAWSADDALLAQAPVAVLAGGPHIAALLPRPDAADLRLSAVRGQVSWLPGGTPGLTAPAAPVAGAGYVIEGPDGLVLFGATSQHHDLDPAVRVADHRHNQAQAWRLGALQRDAGPDPTAAVLAGRVGWRAVTPDRLPIIGPVASATATASPGRSDHPRHRPRLQDDAGGLYVLGGLGSRGITWAALAGRVLAAWVTGCPAPVETDLLYAMDPARFARPGRP